MSLVLHVDGDRWRTHLRSTLASQPGLVPVAKGNGYGLGLGRLARKAQWLGVDTLAVGTYEELPEVARRFDGSLLVLTPWRPDNPLPDEHRVVHTVGRLEDLAALAAHGRDTGHRPRVVVERLTSMLRHGFTGSGLREAALLVAEQGGVEIEGVALHLPLARTQAADTERGEVERLMTDVVGSGLATRTVFVSHISTEELSALGTRYPEFSFRPRVGTALWLGDRSALTVVATVLDRHAVERGDTFGYRGRSAPRSGTILVVSGGTAHGIGLEAPTGDPSLKARAASIARGGLDAAGFVRSPYLIGGKQRLFAEPPHMQASMLFLPQGSTVPDIGDEVEVRVRFTATDVDRVVFG
jgi:alanine racemase